MSSAALILSALLILLIGGALFWWWERRRGEPGAPVTPPDDLLEQGYGPPRWERELALWRGTLRRLQIQARHEATPSPSLQRQIEQAEARIAEAERRLRE